MQKKNFSFVLGFIFGGLIGAIAIFVMGTKDGKKLFDRFSKKAEELEDDIEKKINELKKQGENFVKDAESVKNDIEEKWGDKKTEISSEVMEKMEDTFEKIEKMQEQGVKMTQDVRKKFFKKNGKSLSK